MEFRNIRERQSFPVFTDIVFEPESPLVRSLDDYFYCPHSRYLEDREEDILKHPELQILAKSDEAGVFLVDEPGWKPDFRSGASRV